MWASPAFKRFRPWTDASPTTSRLKELHNPSNLTIQNLHLLKLKNAQLANFLPRPGSSKKGVGCVPSKTWQMSAIISLMSSSPNSLRCNDDDDLQSRVPTIAINPMTQLLTLAPSRWHGLALNSRNCSFSVRPTWDWCHQGASEEVMSESVRGRPGQREMAALIWALRNVMCVRSCETPPALRITFRKALTTWPGSTGVVCQGKRLVSVDSSVSNLYTTLARQTPWEAFFPPWLLVLKDGGPHRKSHADAPARSIDSHCWQSEYWGAVFWAVKTWWKLPPGSSAAFKSNPHLHISHRSRTSAVYRFNPGRGWGGGGEGKVCASARAHPQRCRRAAGEGRAEFKLHVKQTARLSEWLQTDVWTS